MKKRSGFTLIELMIVVAIIGILAAIAIPKFADLVRKSSEGAAKGNLTALRSAMSIYYGDMEGQYPADPAALTVGGKYIARIPVAKTPNYHGDLASIYLGSTSGGFQNLGGWFYDSDPTDAAFGSLWVDCTHTDTRGSVWTAY
jgi:prepilin-type N-terminal cleavage/methylation domain-containing protein